MKWHNSARNILLAAAFAGFWVSGCGSKSAANQVVVSVVGTASFMLPGQTQTITANVTGATDVTSTFACTYTTTPNPTTAVPNPKPSASAACDTAKIPAGDPDAGTPAVGTLTPVASTITTVASTATFLAPKDFPDQKTFPNVAVTITATSNADKKKTGTFAISFDSGVRIRLSPATATLGTVESKQFLAFDVNGLVVPPAQLTWGVTFESTAKTGSASCSGGTNDCGSIDQTTGTYTAPAKVPTAAPSSTTAPVNAAGIVTVFAFSKVDNARIAQAAVTIVTAGDIAYTGISPMVAPQGGLFQDIFLAATNATSQIGVTMDPTDSNCTQVSNTTQHFITFDPAQIKVVFAPGAANSSIGVRVRLNTSQLPDQLKVAGNYQIQVFSSNPSVKVNPNNPNLRFCLKIQPVRPTIVSTSPDNFQEFNLGNITGLPFVIDGGFFGSVDAPTVAADFNGQALQSASFPSPRRISGVLPAANANGKFAGLFPVSVTYSTTAAPLTAPNPASAFSNMAVIPDYGGSNPPLDITNNNQPLTLKSVSQQPPPPNPPKIYVGPAPLLSFGATSAPSSIAVDRTDNLAVVTLAGVSSNNVQFIDLTGSVPAKTISVSSGGNIATSVAVDDQLSLLTPSQSNLAVVVNYGSKSLSILSVPAGSPVKTLDLSCAIPQSACQASTEPFPYSVGIDPIAHRAVVAFASTNIGLIVNLNGDTNVTKNLSCLPNPPNITWSLPYCPIAYVTLNSGTNPQVAFEPGGRLTYVTPGGAGILSAMDLAHPSGGSVGVSSATRASNVVTVATAVAHNLNPSGPGTVLISGLPLNTNGADFNGSFSIGSILDAKHFQYFQVGKDETSTCPLPPTPSTPLTCTATSGVPFLTYTLSPSLMGIAFNPITRNAVLADPNATFSQITFIDPKSQTVNSMSLFSEETGPASTGVGELGAAQVAFQPFTNTAVSFNPNTNEVSLLDPSLSQRPAIVTTGTGQTGLTTLCFTGSGVLATCNSTATPAQTTVTILGAIAVDPISNVVLTLNSGSGTLTGFRLGNIKTVHIERVQTPAIDDATIGTPANLSPAAKITLGGVAQDIGPVRIFGSGFSSTPVQVRLDGIDVSTLGATVTPVGNQEIDVTFPKKQTPNGPVPFFSGPRHFALDVVTSAPTNLNHSNVVDFTVVEEIPLRPCNVVMTPPSSTPAAPGGVAIDEVNNLAVVTNMGCHQVSVFGLDSASLNPANLLDQIVKTIATGDTPTGVAVLPSLAYHGQAAGTKGVAVVTNSGSNTVSLVDLVNRVQIFDATGKTPLTVTVGTNPSGVAIDQETNLAVIANTGSTNVSTIDLTPLTANPIGALTPSTVVVDPNPIAVAIDPDRGTNGRGLAVVSCLIPNGASSPSGALDAVDIGGSTPVRSTTGSTSFLTATPTGVVFDPAVSPAVFYAVATQGNVITAFNPDTGGTQNIKVGINPNAIAYNFQTGTILTVNSVGNTISIVDSQTFATRATLGIGGSSNFAAAIQTFTNLAVIADHDNNRVLLFPLPK